MEGDAVHRTAARLDALAGAGVVRSDLRHPAVAGSDLRGATLAETRAHGKHLLTRLVLGGRRLTLHSHLRMDGSWTVVRKHRDDGRPALPRHLLPRLRAAITLDTGVSLVGLGIPVLELLGTRDEHRTGMTTTGVRRRGENHWVTGRSTRPCRRCGTLVRFRPAGISPVAPLAQAGAPLAREVWWCPSCQPAP